MSKLVKKRQDRLLQLLGFNFGLFLFLLLSLYGITFIKSSVLEYSNIKSDPFNGTVYPISYVPNWLNVKNTNKSIDFSDENLSIDEFIEIPKYDTNLLSDSSGKNKDAIMARYTYPVLYMGDYKLDYEEFAGSHLGVDIRAPIGTPVLSIANGVVIKVKNTTSGDGKYVVIRHDDVNYKGIVETYYSGYEHLNDIFVDEGTKINKGDVLGKVGMTGITTTPHLHFQIDKKSAPFHPYWPYTFAEANAIGLDFFSAINAGLGKENAIAYTINPMEFIQDNLGNKVELNSAPVIDTAKAQENTSPKLATIENQIENTGAITNNTLENTGIIKNTDSEIKIENTDSLIDTKPVQDNSKEINETPKVIENTQVTNSKPILKEGMIFGDIDLNSKLYTPTKYLYENGITKGCEDGNFKPENNLSRLEALIFIFKLYNLKLDSNRILYFTDIKSSDFIVPYLKKALDLGYISANKKFRPNDTISRAEFVTMLVKASGKKILNTGNTGFSDIKKTDWYSIYVETFTNLFISTNKGIKFEPNNTFSRGQIAQILYIFAKNK